MKWMPTCRETTELASRAMDEPLPIAGRMSMWLHLAMCKNCARFTQQLQEMRRQFRMETADDHEAAGLAPDARERIANKLPKTPGS